MYEKGDLVQSILDFSEQNCHLCPCFESVFGALAVIFDDNWECSFRISNHRAMKLKQLLEIRHVPREARFFYFNRKTNDIMITKMNFAALVAALSAGVFGAQAADFEVDGICYNILADESQAVELVGVSSQFQGGTLDIPQSVTHDGVTYTVTSIGTEALMDNQNLLAVKIPGSVASIGTKAFEDCWNLATAEIANGVVSIGESAFADCVGLTAMYIPESVTTIGNGAIEGCENMKTLEIHGNITSMGHYAFADCLRLTSLVIGDGVTCIGYAAFAGCGDLPSVVVPESVTSIDYYAFGQCDNLQTIELPNNVTYIGSDAFSGCDKLAAIKIPEGVTSINDYTFYDCDALTEVYIHDGITSIGIDAFSSCDALTKLHIGKGVTSIGMYAFGDCTSLASIYCSPMTPPAADAETFSEQTQQTATLIVPVGARSAYATTAPWSNFLNIEESDVSSIETVEADECSVWSADGRLMFGGFADGENVKVYGTSGQLVYDGVKEGCPQLVAGLYIVSIDDLSYKVMVK